MSDNILTVEDLAARWKCSTDVIYDMLTSGHLRGFKVGRSWRISINAVINYEGGYTTNDTQ